MGAASRDPSIEGCDLGNAVWRVVASTAHFGHFPADGRGVKRGLVDVLDMKGGTHSCTHCAQRRGRPTPHVVFRYVADPTRFAEWQYDVVRVLLEVDSPLGEGARFTTTGGSAGRNAP